MLRLDPRTALCPATTLGSTLVSDNDRKSKCLHPSVVACVFGSSHGEQGHWQTYKADIVKYLGLFTNECLVSLKKKLMRQDLKFDVLGLKPDSKVTGSSKFCPSTSTKKTLS